jgi:hypothetical protein
MLHIFSMLLGRLVISDALNLVLLLLLFSGAQSSTIVTSWLVYFSLRSKVSTMAAISWLISL